MNLYIYGDGNGNYYQGRSPTGRVRYTPHFETAAFFTEGDKDDAEDCIELGLCLYSLEISEPILVSAGSAGAAGSCLPEKSFKDWEVHKMNLFGSED